MAEFFDFGTYTVDADLTTQGWTSLWHTDGVYTVRSSAEAEYGDKVVEISSNVNQRQVIVPDGSPSNETEFDVIARFRHTTAADDYRFRIALAASGTDTSEDASIIAVYYDGGFRAVTYVNGTGTVLDNVTTSVDTTQWTYYRTKRDASGNHYASMSTTLSDVYDSNNPTADPSIGWQAGPYDVSAVSAGAVGISTQQTGWVAELDWLGVGYGGEAAPVAPAATGIDLSLVSKTNNSVEISWTDDATWDTYQIERDLTVIDTVPGTQFTYTDSGLTSSTSFDYRVRGYRTT